MATGEARKERGNDGKAGGGKEKRDVVRKLALSRIGGDEM
jgi:hypothetical protein